MSRYLPLTPDEIAAQAIAPGQLAQADAEEVSCIPAILENLSLEIATSAEARQMPALKGGDAVNF